MHWDEKGKWQLDPFQGEDSGPGAPTPHPPEAQSPGVVEPEHQSPDVSFTDAYTNTHTPGPNS